MFDVSSSFCNSVLLQILYGIYNIHIQPIIMLKTMHLFFAVVSLLPFQKKGLAKWVHTSCLKGRNVMYIYCTFTLIASGAIGLAK